MGVQRRKARDLWEGHQVVAPSITDQALDLALVVALTRSAKAVEEQVVRLQLGKAARALPSAIAQDAGHRQLGVVIQDRTRHPPKEAEGGNNPVEKGLGALGRVGFDKAGIRLGQVKAEEVDGLPDPAMTATASPKSTWA